MMRIFAVFIFVLGQMSSLWACKNFLDETKNRAYHVPERLVMRDLQAEKPALLKDAEHYLATFKETNDWNAYSDYGVTLTFLGRYKEAEKVYDKIAGPDMFGYVWASNIGTLYELMGRNEEAYVHIQEAYRSYRGGHAGSEWIHVNILDVKRTPGKPASSQNLIGTDFGKDVAPITTLSLKKLAEMSKHLRAQLHERMAFVHPKDSIVARLIFDLANIQVLLGQFDLAGENYEWARKYGMAGELLEARIAYLPEAEQKAQQANIEAARAKEAAARAEQEKVKLAKSSAEDEAFWERMGAMAWPVLALLGVGIYFLVRRMRKPKA